MKCHTKQSHSVGKYKTIFLVFLFSILFIFAFSLYGQSQDQIEEIQTEVYEEDNSLFTKDKTWRGADGAATIDLGNGKILWLFSDTFIDTQATGKRSNSRMIRNSIAIQEGYDLEGSKITFYHKGTQKKPKSFFELPGKTWFWTGHGTLINDNLIVFLFEEQSTEKGIGFEAIGWYVAIIENPYKNPLNWNIRYVKGIETYGVIVGSSAVLKDKNFIYAYGVTEPATHETYLLRMPVDKLIKGGIVELEWWIEGDWKVRKTESPAPSPLFIGQTEFSVHYQRDLNQYIQIQTYGVGHASIGYRLAEKPEGPWSDPVIFYKPHLESQKDFVYSANSHPKMTADGILITYNINNSDFGELIRNEDIYFPKLIKIKLSR
ncbi:MAG: DUF4185 domain-containing protein [Bacteroidales bacterium]|nr:DUF4185 domain-containing protein [Bacteroidales bacterium]